MLLTAKWPREGFDLDRQAGGPDRDRIERDPGDAGHRRPGRAPDGLPAHAELQRAGTPPRRSTRSTRPRSSATTRRSSRRRARNDGGFPYTPNERTAMETPPEERQQIFEGLWEEGGFKFLWGGFSDITRDLDANQIASDFIRDKIREIVKDPATAEMLCPKDHPFASKRPPIDTDYFDTYNRDNVKLVDLREHADRGDHADGHPDDRRALRPRRHRLRDRVRRRDRGVATDGHPRLRRCALSPTSGPTGPARSSGCRSPGSPTCSPSPARAARRSSRTCRSRSSSTWSGSPTASPTCASTATTGSKPPRTRRMRGPTTSPRSRRSRSSRRRTPGTSGPTSRASRGSSCPTRAEWSRTARCATRPPTRVTAASSSRAPRARAASSQFGVTFGARVRASRSPGSAA